MRLGDTLHVLPVASWLCRKYNTKLDWALDRQAYVEPLATIIRAQPFINKVFFFDYAKLRPKSWPKDVYSCWRPYHRIGNKLPEASQYGGIFDFGYSRVVYESRRMPFFSDHFADEHGFEVDWDFKLEYGKPDPKYAGQTVKLDKFYAPVLEDMPGVTLDEADGPLKNLRYAAGAGNVVSTRTGGAIMLSLARIRQHLRFFDNDWDWYYQMVHSINGGVERI